MEKVGIELDSGEFYPNFIPTEDVPNFCLHLKTHVFELKSNQYICLRYVYKLVLLACFLGSVFLHISLLN